MTHVWIVPEPSCSCDEPCGREVNRILLVAPAQLERVPRELDPRDDARHPVIDGVEPRETSERWALD